MAYAWSTEWDMSASMYPWTDDWYTYAAVVAAAAAAGEAGAENYGAPLTEAGYGTETYSAILPETNYGSAESPEPLLLPDVLPAAPSFPIEFDTGAVSPDKAAPDSRPPATPTKILKLSDFLDTSAPAPRETQEAMSPRPLRLSDALGPNLQPEKVSSPLVHNTTYLEDAPQTPLKIWTRSALTSQRDVAATGAHSSDSNGARLLELVKQGEPARVPQSATSTSDGDDARQDVGKVLLQQLKQGSQSPHLPATPTPHQRGAGGQDTPSTVASDADDSLAVAGQLLLKQLQGAPPGLSITTTTTQESPSPKTATASGTPQRGSRRRSAGMTPSTPGSAASSAQELELGQVKMSRRARNGERRTIVRPMLVK